MVHEESNYCVLSSGRRFYTNGGILGLGPEPDALVSEGYDGDVEVTIDHERGTTGVSGWYDANDDMVGFTREERHAIAQEMIRRWRAWGERA